MLTSSKRSLCLTAASISIALMCSGVLTFSGGGAAFASSPVPRFGPLIEDAVAPASAQFNGVSCAAPGSCTAVGSESHGAAYAIESDGAWGEVTELPATSGVQLFGVSCSATTDCTAVGTDGVDEPIYATESSGTWGPVTELPVSDGTGQFNGVSCTSATDCIAVGIDIGSGDDGGMPLYATESAGAWGPLTTLTDPNGGARFNGVSCISAKDCTAVGTDVTGAIWATEATGTWSAVSVRPMSTADLECGGSGGISCPPGGLYGVSCVSMTECTAVGTDGSVNPFSMTESDGSWGASTKVSKASGVLSGVSCADASDCTAVGQLGVAQPQGISATDTSGKWGSVAEFGSSSDHDDELSAIDCTSRTDCMTVGAKDDQPAHAGTIAGSPSIETAIAGKQQATITFSAPADDGGAPITGYQVLRSFPGDLELFVSPSPCAASPCRVTGLRGGTTYRFEVVAVTGNGLSLPSSPSTKVTTTATVPYAPRNIAVKPGSSSAIVRWSAPWDGGSSIISYTATAARANGTFTCRSSRTTCTIHGLRNGRTYTLSVVARNVVGTSKSSATKTVRPQG